VRAAFARTLAEVGEYDPRVLLLTADLGFMALEPFSDRVPNQFLNVGVAEQNMVGLATGLADAGFIPFLYSIATFASLRPYEFIRNGPVQQRLPVRVVGVGGGFEYGTAGISHHGLEDVAVMRVQPGLTVIAPADHEQARRALLATWDLAGPIYYRLGKDDRTVVPGLGGRFELGRATIVREGPDVLLISMGAIAAEVAGAAELLAESGVGATVAVISSLNPTPETDLLELLRHFSVAITIEAHYVSGGLGSVVSELLAENGTNCRLVRCGVRGVGDGRSGSQEYLQRLHGLDSQALAQTAMRALQPRHPVGSGLGS
jgi:transketolase